MITSGALLELLDSAYDKHIISGEEYIYWLNHFDEFVKIRNGNFVKPKCSNIPTEDV